MEKLPHTPATPEAFIEGVHALMETMLQNDLDENEMGTAVAIDNNIAANVRLLLDVLKSELLTGGEPISEEADKKVQTELTQMQLLVDEFVTFPFEDKLKIMELLRNMPLEDLVPSHLNEFLLIMIRALEPNDQIELLDDLEAEKEKELIAADPSSAIAARYLYLFSRVSEGLTAEEDEEANQLADDPKLNDTLEKLSERITVEVKNDLIERLTVIISKPFRGDIAEA